MYFCQRFDASFCHVLTIFVVLRVQYNISSCKHENRLNKEYFTFPLPWKTLLSCAVRAHPSFRPAVAPLFNVTEESWGLFLLAPQHSPRWHSPLKCHINSNKALPYQGPRRPGSTKGRGTNASVNTRLNEWRQRWRRWRGRAGGTSRPQALGWVGCHRRSRGHSSKDCILITKYT